MPFSPAHLNYLHVLVIALAGFLVGCLWTHGLFGKSWLAEMNLTKETMETALRQRGMGRFLGKSIGYTLLSTWGLALLLPALRPATWPEAALYGAFIGLFFSGIRHLHAALWAPHRPKLLLLHLTQEMLVFALQAALLTAWR